MGFSAQHIRQAQLHLRKTDPVMNKLIKKIGPFTLKPQRDRFDMLVRSIVSQQISVAAARTILGRLKELVVPRGGMNPQSFVGLSIDDLRQVGVSQQKASYVLDLATRANDGSLDLALVTRWTDEKIIEHLVQVKGIGRWTAEMFLIFSLGRLDVLPVDDLGIRKAVQKLYELDELPDKKKVHEIGADWRPFATVASWYCWRSLDNTPKD
jgi:DNA-3-methyladenine glycosylase II